MACNTPNVKRKVLNLLSENMKVLELDKKGISSRKIAGTFQIGKTQNNNILKRKLEYLEDYENNVDPGRMPHRHVTGKKKVVFGVVQGHDIS